MSISIRQVQTSELDTVLSLLSASELTTSGLLEDASLVLVVPGEGGVSACAAIESDNGDALLRSVAVVDSARGSGLGSAIVARMEEEARAMGIRTMYLLTTTAEGFFERIGYHRIERHTVPEVVRSSAEFSACASAGATAMRKSI